MLGLEEALLREATKALLIRRESLIGKGLREATETLLVLLKTAEIRLIGRKGLREPTKIGLTRGKSAEVGLPRGETSKALLRRAAEAFGHSEAGG